MAIQNKFYRCSLSLAMELVGGKWKMVILWHLRDKEQRFSELKRLLGEITQKMLTQQLRELEEAGLVTRTVYPVVPPKVEYRLTEQARELVPLLAGLRSWSMKYAEDYGVSMGVCTTGCSE